MAAPDGWEVCETLRSTTMPYPTQGAPLSSDAMPRPRSLGCGDAGLPCMRRSCEFGSMQETNFYVTAALDRAGQRRRDEAWLAERLADPRSLLLPVWRGQNLLRDSDQPVAAMLERAEAAQLLEAAPAIALLGLVGGIAHFAVDVS